MKFLGGFPFCILPDDTVGPGTAWPVALGDIQHLGKTYWRRKQIVLDGNIVTRETATMHCVQKSASAGKCHFTEFGTSPSVPPKIYRTKTTNRFGTLSVDGYDETVTINETTVESYNMDCYPTTTCSGGGSGHFGGSGGSPDEEESYTLNSDCTVTTTDPDDDGVEGIDAVISGALTYGGSHAGDTSFTETPTVQTTVRHALPGYTGSITTVVTLSDEFTTYDLESKVDTALGTDCSYAVGDGASCFAYKNLAADETSASKTRLCFYFTSPQCAARVFYTITFTPDSGDTPTVTNHNVDTSSAPGGTSGSATIQIDPEWSDPNGTWTVEITDVKSRWPISETINTHEQKTCVRSLDGICYCTVAVAQPSTREGYVCFGTTTYSDGCDGCKPWTFALLDVGCKKSAGAWYPSLLFTAGGGHATTLTYSTDHIDAKFRSSATGASPWDFEVPLTIYGAIDPGSGDWASHLTITLQGEWWP